jgi:2-polyprenyl-3-methyl-5-hydroxy-6-metoxy-1,4-benzoquinol methylase
LRDVEEMGRYAVIAAYVRHYTRQPRVLDLGCGEAILYEHLSSPLHYTGLDLSAAALSIARVPAERAKLIAGDVETFTFAPDDRFDAIVLNEVLYYVNDPKSVLERCLPLMAPPGIVVVSMFSPIQAEGAWPSKVEAAWRAVEQAPLRAIDETELSNVPSRRSWRIRVLGR